MRTAIVIGATGLVGNNLIDLLCKDPNFCTIKVFHRREIKNTNPKIEFHLIDFNKLSDWAHLITGDVLFSALGTTIKTAGSKEKQFQVDYTYQHEVAIAAAENKVETYVLVSAKGAKADASFFYMQIKGGLERDCAKLPFASQYYVRPNLLVGDRKESRMGEKVGEAVLNALNAIGILTSQKPIQAEDVASKMIEKALESKKGITILEGAALELVVQG